jgi:hypothetical protein
MRAVGDTVDQSNVNPSDSKESRSARKKADPPNNSSYANVFVCNLFVLLVVTALTELTDAHALLELDTPDPNAMSAEVLTPLKFMLLPNGITTFGVNPTPVTAFVPMLVGDVDVPT